MTRRLVIIFLLLAPMMGCTRQPAPNPEFVDAKFLAGELPAEDPGSKLWQQAPEHPARLLPQNLTEPMLTEPGVELVRVRALHNNDWVVFRLEWNDPTQDLIPVTGQSCDAAAIQFPLATNGNVPDAAMGESGKGVRIWYWKAVWQDDAARAQAGKGDRIASLYPNAAIDHYPYQAGGAAREEMERRYAPARAAANPITVRPEGTAVQVLVAEGFGNTRLAPAQSGRGRGQWVNGRWMTTIARPLRGGTALGDLAIDQRTHIALAIWDGAKAHTGSRKMRSEWIPVILRKP